MRARTPMTHTAARTESGATAWRLRLGVLLVVPLLLGANCGTDNPVEPGTVGTVQGMVTADGVGLSGVNVSLGAGLSTTTGADGTYRFADVPQGVLSVTIGGFPPDVTFDSTTKTAVVTTPGQVVVVGFAGRRAGGQAGASSVAGSIKIAGGDRSHDPSIFTAGDGKRVTVKVDVRSATIIIEGVSGFAPVRLPAMSGTLKNDGTFTATGFTEIAGIKQVMVTATGTYIDGVLTMGITAGGDGKLPGGKPITYAFAK